MRSAEHGPADPEKRPRRRRRAVGGTRPTDGGAPPDGDATRGGAPASDDTTRHSAPDPFRRGAPDPFRRSADDTDAGWGETPDPDDDDRLRREVPPHW